MNIFDSTLNSNRKFKYYSVEVITFDGDSYTGKVEARSAEEAQEIAEPNSITSITQWFRAASQVGKIFSPSKGETVCRFDEPKDEEIAVTDTPHLCTKDLHFGVECFGRAVGYSPSEVVEFCRGVVPKHLDDRAEVVGAQRHSA